MSNTMKTILLLLITMNACKTFPEESRSITESTSVQTPTSSESVDAYDFVVEIGFNLDEAKVPEYLVDTIYENSTENSITTDDVLSLYGLKNVTLENAFEILNQLNISVGNVFGLNGFDKFLTELRIDFKEFYNRVIIGRLNITGNPLRDLLVTLQIDINNFSMGMAYGDPNPYDEFKKGNFSEESVRTALQKAGKTADDLFLACRDEFVLKVVATDTAKIVESLVKYDFDKQKALKLWNILGLNMENVYKVATFKELLNDLNRKLNKKPSIGVVTGANNITINKKVYETWKNEEDIVTLYAESITNKFILQIVDKKDTDLDNIIVLKSISVEPYNENNIPYINTGTTSDNLANCKFLTIQNGTVLIKDIPIATNYESYIAIPRSNVVELILGSPLICQNKVYGLAREIDSENIVLDSFSDVSRLSTNRYLLVISALACVCIYFL